MLQEAVFGDVNPAPGIGSPAAHARSPIWLVTVWDSGRRSLLGLSKRGGSKEAPSHLQILCPEVSNPFGLNALDCGFVFEGHDDAQMFLLVLPLRLAVAGSLLPRFRSISPPARRAYLQFHTAV